MASVEADDALLRVLPGSGGVAAAMATGQGGNLWSEEGRALHLRCITAYTAMCLIPSGQDQAPFGLSCDDRRTVGDHAGSQVWRSCGVGMGPKTSRTM